MTPFRAPTSEELARDYLWRVHQSVPRRGVIGIFNRSHYEDVLVVKVRKLATADVVEKRYDQINAFEKHLSENGTAILKFMLHISREEQGIRLQERLDDPEKRWKFNPDDLEDRKLWDDYQAAYDTMINRCSTAWAPWYVIPADRNWARNWTVAHRPHDTRRSRSAIPEARLVAFGLQGRISGEMRQDRIIPLVVASALFMENLDSTVIATRFRQSRSTCARIRSS